MFCKAYCFAGNGSWLKAAGKDSNMNKRKVAAGVFIILWAALVCGLYYFFLPALNIHSRGLWTFVMVCVLLPACVLVFLYQLLIGGKELRRWNGKRTGLGRFGTVIAAVIVLLFIVCAALEFFGSPLFHAKRYASILQMEEYDFKEDIVPSENLSQIALMDTNSAVLLGDREIGTLSEVVSQFNLSREYAQIDLNGLPVKVSALDYADFFKYMGNKEAGIPGYVKVDPVGQKAEYVKLSGGMKYVPSAFFGKDLQRHLRKNFPTKIFGNTHFEIDEEGNPFYVASVYEYTIGVFGGETVCGAIICDPVSGDCTYFDAAEIPKWIDNAFDGNLLVQQYNWYGKYNNGFWNSLLAKKGCKKCTETMVAYSEDEDVSEEEYTPDFGYVAKDGDIWIYTGITSVNDDASNIGFILVNERTSEAHYFSIAGADENSAMAAAEGEVQEKAYKASFPSLINVEGEPTYVMVLKDASGIVKLYGMVNVESYNIVTTASNLEDCFRQYRKRLGIEVEEKEEDTEDVSEKIPVEFTVGEIRYIDVEGNTWLYLTSTEGVIYKQPFAENERLLLIKEGAVLKGGAKEEKDGIFRFYSE